MRNLSLRVWVMRWVLLLATVAVLSSACGGGQQPACPCPLPNVQTITTGDGSQVTLAANTAIAPCGCIGASYIAYGSLPDQGCLPCDPEKAEATGCSATVITTIDVTPDGCTFTPAGTLHFHLPVAYSEGDELFIYYHTGGGCPGAWLAAGSTAAVVTPSGDYADGPFSHSTIFALVDLRGDFNALGLSRSPFQAEQDAISFDLAVTGSSTNPELRGKQVRFYLVGLDTTDLKGLANTLNEQFKVGSTLLLHHEPWGQLTITSEFSVTHLAVEGVKW
jgi:hypothetical protein